MTDLTGNWVTSRMQSQNHWTGQVRGATVGSTGPHNLDFLDDDVMEAL
jgi:hypothetical protein